MRLGQTTSDITSAIASAAASYGIDPNLALEVAIQESNLNENAVSSAGAIGIFQLMPATAAALGVDPTDWQQNIQGGCMLLAQLMQQFGGNLEQVLAAYNWGSGNVSGAISKYGSANWLAYAPSETQNYVSAIEANLGTQYSVSTDSTTGTSATASAIPGQVTEAGVLPTSTGTSLSTVALVLIAAIIGITLMDAITDG